jgi:hypothetical protein
MDIHVGQKIGKLLVLRQLASRGKNSFFECKCECGSVVPRRRDHLTEGRESNCGCVAREASERAQARDAEYASRLTERMEEASAQQSQNIIAAEFEHAWFLERIRPDHAYHKEHRDRHSNIYIASIIRRLRDIPSDVLSRFFDIGPGVPSSIRRGQQGTFTQITYRVDENEDITSTETPVSPFDERFPILWDDNLTGGSISVRE